MGDLEGPAVPLHALLVMVYDSSFLSLRHLTAGRREE